MNPDIRSLSTISLATLLQDKKFELYSEDDLIDELNSRGMNQDDDDDSDMCTTYG
jgi:hypothetical protein